MEIEVAVMEPKYQVNLGYIARVSKNFGIKKLFLINPRCRHRGKEAIKYSKHAVDLLRKAKICKSIKGIGSGFVIGTTGIWHKTGESFYNTYSIENVGRMAERASKSGRKTIVLLGRDDIGLTKEELRECDATISIETGSDYPILNISHALAIVLHSLKNAKISGKRERYADPSSEKNLLLLFKRLVNENPRIKDKKSVNMAFRHVIRRAMPTGKETNALSIALALNKDMPGRKIKRK
jgi:tRNA/rRNA methyltransferase